MKGIILILALICSLFQNANSQNQKLPDLNAATKEKIIDSITSALNKYYVFPDEALKMADYLNKQFKNKRYDLIVNPNEFANKIVTDIHSIYNDKHLTIRYDPDLEKRILNFKESNEVDKLDLIKEEKQNFYFRKVEVLPSNIGYMEFTNFADTSKDANETVRAAMQFVSHTDALILDLRKNYGGRGPMLTEINNYFFNERTFAGRSYDRLKNKWTDSWIEPNPLNRIVMNMPIYILTSKLTFSAAEGLAYGLQSLRKATVVGEITRGGAHLTRSFSLGNGFVGFVPFVRFENAKTKTDWEGIGVIPDVKANENKSMLTTQRIIVEKQLMAATDENEKRKLIWLKNNLISKDTVFIFSESELKKFTGQFEEFEFYLKEDQLFCKNTHQVDKVDRLAPINSTLFQIDNDTQVEFILNKTGTCDMIKLYWNDGWVDTISRTHV